MTRGNAAVKFSDTAEFDADFGTVLYTMCEMVLAIRYAALVMADSGFLCQKILHLKIKVLWENDK